MRREKGRQLQHWRPEAWSARGTRERRRSPTVLALRSVTINNLVHKAIASITRSDRAWRQQQGSRTFVTHQDAGGALSAGGILARVTSGRASCVLDAGA